MPQAILVLNSGSSSIKFGVFDARDGGQPACLFRGSVEHIDQNPHLHAKDSSGSVVLDRSWSSEQSEEKLIDSILTWLDGEKTVQGIAAIGHRIVHGGSKFVAPTLLTKQALEEIAALTPMAPLHQERCISPARTLMRMKPDIVQIGCFDTAFHAALKPPASRFALPRRYEREGIRRYGFHGLSFEYIAGELERRFPATTGKATVIAHLGNGASLCALRDGESRDTTMGMTPLDGLMMGTRSGSIDPGVVLYLQREHAMTASAVENMLYHDAGLLGVSGVSSDMQKLLASDKTEAAEAIDLFAFIAAKAISAMACTLGGIDRLVFTGGIGEHAPEVRKMIGDRLLWLGAGLDHDANRDGAQTISSSQSKIELLVIPTNEEAMIAHHVRKALPLKN